MNNPFHYGTPAEGEYFTGREVELEALVSRMRGGINVVLLSPRRYGKTSLHREAQRVLTRSRPAGVAAEVNVLRADSLSGLLGLLTAHTFRLPGARWHRAARSVPEFLRRVRVAPVVTLDPSGTPRFSFTADLVSRDAEGVLEDVYRTLAEEATRRPTALILDEFQAVTRLGTWLPDVLKALADEHPGVSLVLAGSKRHLMESLVVEAGAPLYGMAQKLALGPLPDAEMLAYLQSRSEAAGHPMPAESARAVIELAGPVPNDIQHLAFEAFEMASTVVDLDVVHRAMARAVGHEATLYAESFARFSPGQCRTLSRLAAGTADPPYSARFSRSVGLANASSVRKALQPLILDEVVAERDGRLVVTDPFFAAWLRPAGAE